MMAEASARYFHMFGEGTQIECLTDALTLEIVTLREQIRAEEAGGMCHLVAEELRCRYGWEPLPISYLSIDGRIIADHVVSILPDGSIIDGTRDQFGEGHSVSFIRPGDYELARYRPEFTEDWHPGHPDDIDGDLDAWKAHYTGKPDYLVKDETLALHGRGWWLSDTILLDEFERSQGIGEAAMSFT